MSVIMNDVNRGEDNQGKIFHEGKQTDEKETTEQVEVTQSVKITDSSAASNVFGLSLESGIPLESDFSSKPQASRFFEVALFEDLHNSIQKEKEKLQYQKRLITPLIHAYNVQKNHERNIDEIRRSDKLRCFFDIIAIDFANRINTLNALSTRLIHGNKYRHSNSYVNKKQFAVKMGLGSTLITAIFFNNPISLGIFATVWLAYHFHDYLNEGNLHNKAKIVSQNFNFNINQRCSRIAYELVIYYENILIQLPTSESESLATLIANIMIQTLMEKEFFNEKTFTENSVDSYLIDQIKNSDIINKILSDFKKQNSRTKDLTSQNAHNFDAGDQKRSMEIKSSEELSNIEEGTSDDDSTQTNSDTDHSDIERVATQAQKQNENSDIQDKKALLVPPIPKPRLKEPVECYVCKNGCNIL